MYSEEWVEKFIHYTSWKWKFPVRHRASASAERTPLLLQRAISTNSQKPPCGQSLKLPDYSLVSGLYRHRAVVAATIVLMVKPTT